MKSRREGEDRISNLLQRLLHKILSYLTFLDPKEAVQREEGEDRISHLPKHVSTSPNVKFSEECFTGENKKETFLSFVETTLQRYQDQKLSIKDFCLEMSEVDSESTRLLEKWVPIVMLNMGVKTFSLYVDSETSPYFDLPWGVLKAQLPLQNLKLQKCKFSQYVGFKHLETLDLWQVYIEDETFEKIMSCCPSIEDVTLQECEGLKTIKVMADKLKRFEFKDYKVYKEDKDCCKIKIDAPTIERITIWGCPNWFDHHCHKNFLHLKDLYLSNVRLSTKSFGTFLQNFTCLEDLSLYSCFGFKVLKLSSSSIQRLTISGLKSSMNKVTIDVPNIIYFEYNGNYLPSSFSFTTAFGRGWKSELRLDIGCLNDSPSFFKLNEVLKALSQSEISLDISNGCCYYHAKDTNKGGLIERVAVEHLVLRGPGFVKIPPSTFSSMLNMLFRVCRPRNIKTQLRWPEQKEDEELTKLLCKFLLQKRKARPFFVGKSSLFSNYKPKTMFRLKWR